MTVFVSKSPSVTLAASGELCSQYKRTNEEQTPCPVSLSSAPKFMLVGYALLNNKILVWSGPFRVLMNAHVYTTLPFIYYGFSTTHVQQI